MNAHIFIFCHTRSTFSTGTGKSQKKTLSSAIPAASKVIVGLDSILQAIHQPFGIEARSLQSWKILQSWIGLCISVQMVKNKKTIVKSTGKSQLQFQSRLPVMPKASVM